MFSAEKIRENPAICSAGSKRIDEIHKSGLSDNLVPASAGAGVRVTPHLVPCIRPRPDFIVIDDGSLLSQPAT
jgi:hypothetical protein